MRSRLAGHSGGRARLLYVQRRVWMRAPMALDLEKQRAPSPGRPGSPASSERRLKVTADGASAPQQHQQPAAQPAPAAGSTPPLKFSIERILSSEFGPTGGRSVPTAAAVVTAKESQQPRKEDRTKPTSERSTTPPTVEPTGTALARMGLLHAILGPTIFSRAPAAAAQVSWLRRRLSSPSFVRRLTAGPPGWPGGRRAMRARYAPVLYSGKEVAPRGTGVLTPDDSLALDDTHADGSWKKGTSLPLFTRARTRRQQQCRV
ncbi:hypothetical protein MTO96_009393 [Rhipicephalus appendiculatus]